MTTPDRRVPEGRRAGASSRGRERSRPTPRARPVWWHVVLLALGGVVLVLVMAALAERVAYRGRVLPGVEVAGVEVAGDDEEAASAAVADLAATLEAAPVRARVGDTELVLDPATIAFRVDVAATVDAARAAGRTRNPIGQLVGPIARRVVGTDVALDTSWDDDALDQVLDGWAAQLSEGLENGGLRFEGATVVEVEPVDGVGLRQAEAKAAIEVMLRSPSRDDIVELPFGPATAVVDREEVARAAAEARALLAAPVTLQVDGGTVTIEPAQLGASMSADARGDRLVLAIDPFALHEQLAPQLAPYEVTPVDAGFEVAGTTVTVIPAQLGRSVDLLAATPDILAGIRRVAAAVVDVAPTRTTEWAQSLRITELVSTFTTSFTPGQSRVTNIARAAEIVDGTIVEPGQTFSLNEALGPRTAENGFVKAGAFSTEDGFYEEYGGGVSQFSTTLFNATFFAGYEDVAHTPHTIYISRYPMGREATLNYGSIENIFRNDSECGVLIKSYAASSAVTVSYYSCKDREVVAEGPTVLEEIPIETEYVENLFLPAGEQEPVEGESGYTGYVVENYRTIKRPGQPDQRERFSWTYDMRPRKIYVGVAPAAEPAPTPPP